jgi:hypothetical protein
VGDYSLPHAEPISEVFPYEDGSLPDQRSDACSWFSPPFPEPRAPRQESAEDPGREKVMHEQIATVRNSGRGNVVNAFAKSPIA